MIELPDSKIFKFFFWLAVIAVCVYVFTLIIDIFLILAISLLLGFIFAPFVHLLEERGLNRLSSTLIVFISFGFLLYLGVSFIIPQFTIQLGQLINNLEGLQLNEEIKAIEATIIHYLPVFKQGELAGKIEHFISSQIVGVVDNFSSLISGIVGVIAVLVIVPFISFFLVKDSSKIQQAIIHIVPNKYFEMSYWIIKRVSLQLGRFVRAWIFDATFVGVMIGFGFYLIGLPNAMPLGVIAGLGHLIPYLGPAIGGIPAIILSIIQFGDFSQVPLIMLIVLITYTIDNGFVQPYVFAKSVDMHPIVIILLIVLGSQLFGVFGMLLAVPVASVLKTMTTETYFAFKNYKIARL